MNRETELHREAIAYSEQANLQQPAIDLAEEAFKDGAHWADSHPHWISVDEELPPLHQHILIALTEEHTLRLGSRDVSEYIFMDEKHRDRWMPYVTHWMPLPAPPEKGERKWKSTF